ncbi:GLPGLI family protein [Pedobacter agri]|uniref:GLPGLI family protein n=1 Tax=Pedobacter agri TaxID=454586 RepID=A0A9X3I8K1_9SPHI|nr:GLPGLI family protein [Pedobacter agri]MCX3264912.1 GLPGLI family protein [Pedobacter agri]
MKIISTITLFTSCLCLQIKALSQTPHPVVARAIYEYIHVLDTNNRSNTFKEEMLLAIGQNASVFTSLAKIYQTRSMEKQKEEATKNYSGSDFPVVRYKAGRYTTPTEVYRFNTQKKVYVKEFLIRDYLYEEPEIAQTWTLSNDTTSFHGIRCQKASAKFKGRNWEVWFAPDIPFQTGPWLLAGLPGLIIEARDSRNEVFYHLKGFEKAIHSNVSQENLSKNKLVDFTVSQTIQLPEERTQLNAVKVVRASKEEVAKLKQAMMANRSLFRKTQVEASEGIIYNVEASAALALMPVINNPIEIVRK